VRQAWRNGARVYVVGNAGQNDAARHLYDSVAVSSPADIPFNASRTPVVICGASRKGLDSLQFAALEGVRQAFILDGPNAFGTALLALEHGALSLSEEMAGGAVKGIIALEGDLPTDLPPGARVLAAADWMATPLIERAEIVLPVTSWVEMDGTYINNEGRAQRFKQVMQPGLPIKGLTSELHPPRIHRQLPPGGDILPSWRIVSELLVRLGDDQSGGEPFYGRWAPLASLDAESGGIKNFERNQNQ
jgi:NADH-quinone oxidoreductase subunit G